MDTIVIPHPDNPEHVANMASVELMEAQGFIGFDGSLNESLFAYGLAWRDLPDNKLLFVYAHPTIANRFDRCTMDADTDCRREFDWVDWQDIYAFTGIDAGDWHAMPLPNKIGDLVRYHGAENVFGSSYWAGFAIAE